MSKTTDGGPRRFSWAGSAGRWSWLVAAVAVLGVGGAVAWSGHYQAKPVEAAGEDEPIALGDVLLVHLTVYDHQARMLYSTRMSDLPEMQATADAWDGPFVVPALDADSPSRFNVTSDLRPLQMDDGAALLTPWLVGSRVGDRVSIPAVGAFSGYDEQIVLDRVRGPFNRTMTVTNSILQNLTVEADGERVALDGLPPARVVSRGERTSILQFEVRQGDVLPVEQANFTAEVLDAPSPDQFLLRLHTEADHHFTLLKECAFARYVLPVGSYRVDEVTEMSIVLGKADTRWPQLIGRDIIIVLEVAQNLGQEETP